MENIKKIEKMLIMAIFEVLEKMFFVFTELLRGKSSGIYDMKTDISFNGPVNGSMQILFSRGVAETMAKNILDLDQVEVTDQIVADCLKESINMICGNFVRKLDSKRVFHLSIPTVDMISEDFQRDHQTKAHEIRIILAAEDGDIEVSMTAPDIL